MNILNISKAGTVQLDESMNQPLNNYTDVPVSNYRNTKAKYKSMFSSFRKQHSGEHSRRSRNQDYPRATDLGVTSEEISVYQKDSPYGSQRNYQTMPKSQARISRSIKPSPKFSDLGLNEASEEVSMRKLSNISLNTTILKPMTPPRTNF